jgi:hypothetical protein
VLEKIINNFMLISDQAAGIDSAKADIYLSILNRVEATCEKFSFKQMNETSMNYRNIMLQNLFKIYGKLRENETMAHCKCRVIEFYNQELDDQDNVDNYSFEKTLNLKSLLNMGVCLNGGIIRVHDQGQLGHSDQLLHEVLYLREQNQEQRTR